MTTPTAPGTDMGTTHRTRAAAWRSWPVVLAATAALVLAAGIGAVLVFQPDAATSSGAIRLLARFFAGLGAPYAVAAPIVGFSLNVALFVPGAFAAALLWPRVRWWQWVLLGFAVTAAIETVQGVFLPARRAEVQDLIANTLGAALGAGFVVVARQRAARRHTRT